jgi:hypothetical protein
MPWQMPDRLPTPGDLRDAITRCHRTLDGRVSPAFARQCFAKMVTAFEPNAKPSGDETRLRMAVWLEACGDMNDALWADATTEAIQTMKWMPKPAEFRALVTPQIDKARKRKERLLKMLQPGMATAAANPFVKEPTAVRLRGMRDSFRKVGSEAKAAIYERELAKEEGRDPEAWAIAEIVPPAPLPSAKAPPREPLPQSREATMGLLKARIVFFKDMGMLDYVAQMERELAELENAQ